MLAADDVRSEPTKRIAGRGPFNSRREAAMIRHWAFFKQGDLSFGTFYPRHYIVAGYPSLEAAHDAEHAFCAFGVGAHDVRAATGDFVVNQLEAYRDMSWLQRTLSHAVRFAGTESGYLDDDAELAEHGGAFLFLFAPRDATSNGRAPYSRNIRPCMPGAISASP